MKIHYQPHPHKDYVQCGAVIKRNTQTTYHLDAITCRVCMFSFLADAAPWAREFLDGLRKADTAVKRSAGKTLQHGFQPGLGGFKEMEARVMAAGRTAFDRVNPDGMPPALVLAADFGGSVGAGAHGVPMGPSAKTHSPVECLGRDLASLLRQECVPQKVVREFFPEPESAFAAVQVVMEYGGPAAGAVGIKGGKVSE